MNGELPLSCPTSLRDDQPVQHVRVEASATERLGVAALLGVEAVDHLDLTGDLVSVERGFRLRAQLRATVTQACVVTREPVVQRIDVAVERHLVVGSMPEAVDIEIDPEADDIDCLEEPVVDLGLVAVEELSLALDPYPRAPAADAVVARYAPDDAGPSGPFAALAQRRLDA
jgi:hypothetical protein